MTGNRVLTGKDKMAAAPPTAPTVQVATLTVGVKPGDVIKRLQDVVARLQNIEKLNNNLQGQYMQGSAAWESCEKIDDELHEVFTLLGE